jgi:carbon monoxide dehydrogenase subunit G
MKIEQRFTVPFQPERVWDFFRDAAAVVRCLPGAELSEAGADGHVAGRFTVKLGPITAAFSGEADLRYDESARTGEISGGGNDRKTGSRARASAAFALAEEDGGTRVDITVDYTLAGMLAQFGRGGIVRDLAARLTAQFADNLRTALAGEAPAPPAPTDVGKLVLGAVRDRLRRRNPGDED